MSHASVPVSLVLLCYNREHVVGRALASALAQTYSPLEIVVSDDGSSDGTCAIVEGALRAYRGPHTVRFHRSPINRGLGGHVAILPSLARGEVMVFASDDDVSHPDRVARHMAVYARNSAVMAVVTDAIHITPDGERHHARPYGTRGQATLSSLTLARRGGGVGRGATYSYRRRCFEEPGEYPAAIEVEDKLLPFRASVLGRVTYLPEPLVESVMGPDNMSTRPGYVPVRVRQHHQDTLWDEIARFRAAGRVSAWRARLLTFVVATNPGYWERRLNRRPIGRIMRLAHWLGDLPVAPQITLRSVLERSCSVLDRVRWRLL
jgi:glycosyltransferase involved in cell wall biosynthesis